MDGYLTVKEAALALRMKYPSLLRSIQRGTVSGIKVGWVWLIPHEEVERVQKVRGVRQ